MVLQERWIKRRKSLPDLSGALSDLIACWWWGGSCTWIINSILKVITWAFTLISRSNLWEELAGVIITRAFSVGGNLLVRDGVILERTWSTDLHGRMCCLVFIRVVDKHPHNVGVGCLKFMWSWQSISIPTVSCAGATRLIAWVVWHVFLIWIIQRRSHLSSQSCLCLLVSAPDLPPIRNLSAFLSYDYDTGLQLQSCFEGLLNSEETESDWVVKYSYYMDCTNMCVELLSCDAIDSDNFFCNLIQRRN